MDVKKHLPWNIVKIYLSQCSSSSTVRQSTSHWECKMCSGQIINCAENLISAVTLGWMPAYRTGIWQHFSNRRRNVFKGFYDAYTWRTRGCIYIFIPWLPPEFITVFLYLRPWIYPPPQFFFSYFIFPLCSSRISLATVLLPFFTF